MPEFDLHEFRKLFPNLAKEILDGGSQSAKLGDVVKDPLRGYEPSVLDFLARARSVDEGMKVIDYLESRGEISRELASELRNVLQVYGLKAFGERREFGYYHRLAANKRRELVRSLKTTDNELSRDSRP